MPINKEKMEALKKQYGPKTAERIYYALGIKEHKKQNKKKGKSHQKATGWSDG